MVSINFRTTPDTSSTNELHRSRPTSASTGFLHSTSPHRWMQWTPLQRRNDLSESDVDVTSLGPTNATWDCQHLCEDLHACPVSRSCSRLYSVWSWGEKVSVLGRKQRNSSWGFSSDRDRFSLSRIVSVGGVFIYHFYPSKSKLFSFSVQVGWFMLTSWPLV